MSIDTAVWVHGFVVGICVGALIGACFVLGFLVMEGGSRHGHN